MSVGQRILKLLSEQGLAFFLAATTLTLVRLAPNAIKPFRLNYQFSSYSCDILKIHTVYSHITYEAWLLHIDLLSFFKLQVLDLIAERKLRLRYIHTCFSFKNKHLQQLTWTYFSDFNKLAHLNYIISGFRSFQARVTKFKPRNMFCVQNYPLRLAELALTYFNDFQAIEYIYFGLKKLTNSPSDFNFDLLLYFNAKYFKHQSKRFVIRTKFGYSTPGHKAFFVFSHDNF